MPQKDKNARKEYNHKVYLKRKLNQNDPTKDIPQVQTPSTFDYYSFIKFTNNIKCVNNSVIRYHQLNQLYKNIYNKVIQHINNITYWYELIEYFNKYYVIKNDAYFRKNNMRIGGVRNVRCVFGEINRLNYNEKLPITNFNEIIPY
jgi:hypothetical protein